MRITYRQKNTSAISTPSKTSFISNPPHVQKNQPTAHGEHQEVKNKDHLAHQSSPIVTHHFTNPPF
jgi:hypothetical protein